MSATETPCSSRAANSTGSPAVTDPWRVTDRSDRSSPWRFRVVTRTAPSTGVFQIEVLTDFPRQVTWRGRPTLTLMSFMTAEPVAHRVPERFGLLDERIVPASLEDDHLGATDSTMHSLCLRRRAEEVATAHQDERRHVDLAQPRRHVAVHHQLPAAGAGRSAPHRRAEQTLCPLRIERAKAERRGDEFLASGKRRVVAWHVEEGGKNLRAGVPSLQLDHDLVDIVPRRRGPDQ